MTPKKPKKYKDYHQKIPHTGCKRLFLATAKKAPRFGVFANEQGFYRHNGRTRHL